MPRAGRYRHRITIQVATEGDADSFGETSKTWADLEKGKVWAEVRTMDGYELYKAAQVNPKASVRVAMRGRRDITVTTENRFEFGARYLYPLNMIPDVRAREWVFWCSEDV